MSGSLKQKTLSAFMWSFIGQYIVQGLTFVVTVILARLLEPWEFGLIGMLQIFMVISNSLQDFGFNAALIQRSDITTTDYTTIFYFNFAVSIVIYGGLFLAAPWIASFYNEPQLALITRVYMLILITNGLSFIQTTIFTKKIDFKPQVIIRITTAMLSGGIGIVMALTGFGVWSLVVQALSGSLLNSALLWYISKWRPGGFFSIQSLKKMLGFSSRLFASNMLYNIFFRVDNMVIGKLFSAADLGFYTRAQSLKEFPIKNTSTVLERVMFPVFAAIKDNDEKLRNVFDRFLGVVAFVVFPLMLGMTVIADPLIRVLITDKWLPSVIYLQLFCLFGFVKPLRAININILMAKGRADIILNLEIINKILFVIGMVIGFHWGIKGFLIAHLIVNYIIYTILIKYSGKFLNHTVLSQYRRLMPAFLLSLVMAALVYGVGTFFHRHYLWQLVVQIMTGIVVYLVSAYIMKIKAFNDLIVLVKEDILKIKKVAHAGSN
jgi:teichuronic acid exporter